jgi:hypothetical protein
MKKGVKYDGGKDRYDLVPVDAFRQVVKVFTFGSVKYTDDNWKKVQDLQRRYYAAGMRHLEADREGEVLDGESGLEHLAHAIVCMMFKLQDRIEKGDE